MSEQQPLLTTTDGGWTLLGIDWKIWVGAALVALALGLYFGGVFDGEEGATKGKGSGGGGSSVVEDDSGCEEKRVCICEGPGGIGKSIGAFKISDPDNKIVDVYLDKVSNNSESDLKPANPANYKGVPCPYIKSKKVVDVDGNVIPEGDPHYNRQFSMCPKYFTLKKKEGVFQSYGADDKGYADMPTQNYKADTC